MPAPLMAKNAFVEIVQQAPLTTISSGPLPVPYALCMILCIFYYKLIFQKVDTNQVVSNQVDFNQAGADLCHPSTMNPRNDSKIFR